MLDRVVNGKYVLLAWSSSVSTSFTRVKKLLTKLLVLGLTVQCWEVPFVRSTNESLEHRTKPQGLRVSELFFAECDIIFKTGRLLEIFGVG